MHKEDFPFLQQQMDGKPLVYLNSAATTQKPQIVIDALKEFYEHWNMNVHRGSDRISSGSESLFEAARIKVAEFIHASPDEIVFTKNCTEAINLVARGFPFHSGDKVVTTILEHHANFLPWLPLQKTKNVRVEVLDVNASGHIFLDEEKLKGARLLVITHLSNALGTLQEVKYLCDLAHRQGVLVLVDAAQSISHLPVDVQNLDCDFLAFSGHKLFGVHGVGVLYGKKHLLEQLEPLLYGGDMVKDVSLEPLSFTCAEAPRKFEGGTQDVAAVYALGKAVDYLQKIGMKTIDTYMQELTLYALKRLQEVTGMHIFGEQQHGIISFSLQGVHAHDIAEFLSSKGILVRSGHLCCKPLMSQLGIEGVVRVSFHLYTDHSDIDALIDALKTCKEFFTR